MRAVDQTVFGAKEGNCNAACLASLLEIDIEVVPNFCAEVPRRQDWMRAMNEWLSGHFGLCAVTFDMTKGGRMPTTLNALADRTWCIMSGKSPRGDFNHAVVGIYRINDDRHWVEMVHDPHPSRDGLDQITSFDLLIAANPAQGFRTSQHDGRHLERLAQHSRILQGG